MRALDRWTEALTWQRAVDRALSVLELTHTQLLVLRSAAVATTEEGDAVMQQSIADAAGLEKVTTSRLLRKLDQAGLVDKDINGVDARKLRVRVTREGRIVLARACELVAAVAASNEQDLARK